MGESVHTKQNSYQAQNINYAENIHTSLYIKIIISYKFYNVCFLFLRSQSRTKILAYQKICTFTIRTKKFLTARVCMLAVIFWSYKTHLIVKIIFRASAAALIFLDKVTSRWKPQYTIFYLHIFLLFLIFFYKKYKKDFEFGRLVDSYTE